MKTFYYNLVLVLSVACGRLPETETSGDFAGSVPVFNVDPSWPKPLPGDWLLGQVSGLAVDWELRQLMKPLVIQGHFGYSSLAAGRPETPGEGMTFLFYEGEGGGKMARFNLSWLLEGEKTGDGEVPRLGEMS